MKIIFAELFEREITLSHRGGDKENKILAFYLSHSYCKRNWQSFLPGPLVMPTLVNFFLVWLQQSLSRFCFNLFMVSLPLLFNRDFSFEAKEETDSNTGNEGSRPEGKREIYLYILPQFPLLLRKKERKHKYVKAA